MFKGKMKWIPVVIAVLLCWVIMGDECVSDSDDVAKARQETLLAEAGAQIGMPAMKNFREKKLLKAILELRDQADLVTYTYVYCPMKGQFRFIGQSIGYGIPYATQFTNPLKTVSEYHDSSVIEQADPNGLFSPGSADGTWIMLMCPDGKVKPQYMEEKINVFTYKLPASMVIQD
jgi:hypothetical protein